MVAKCNLQLSRPPAATGAGGQGFECRHRVAPWLPPPPLELLPLALPVLTPLLTQLPWEPQLRQRLLRERLLRKKLLLERLLLERRLLERLLLTRLSPKLWRRRSRPRGGVPPGCCRRSPGGPLLG
jgi:hypothetical protein